MLNKHMLVVATEFLSQKKKKVRNFSFTKHRFMRQVLNSMKNKYSAYNITLSSN